MEVQLAVAVIEKVISGQGISWQELHSVHDTEQGVRAALEKHEGATTKDNLALGEPYAWCFDRNM